MMYVIYRKRDRLIVGHVYPRKLPGAATAALSLEIQNIVNSELGGSVSDYSYITCDANNFVQDGYDTILDDDLKVQYVRSNAQTVKDNAKSSVIVKLKTLGLTDDEIEVIS